VRVCGYPTCKGFAHDRSFYCVDHCDYRTCPERAQIPEKPAPEKTSAPDMINSPPHYTGARFRGQPIEPIDVAESFGLVDNNYRATAFYYIVRAGKKGPPVEDLKKAVWWLNREIARMERE
jgi:hypothetical protein